MNTRYLVLEFLFVGLLLLPASGQETPTVILGGQTLRIGMSKQEALSKLSQCCTVSALDSKNDQDGHFVTSHTPGGGDGGVWFADEKLWAVKRDRDSFSEGPALNVGQSVYRWFSGVAQSGSAKVSVQVLTTEGKNMTIRSLKFQLPDGRSLVLEITKMDANSTIPDFMKIDEFYDYPPPQGLAEAPPSAERKK